MRLELTATTFKEFLTRLMVGASKPIFLIVDGHPIHKSKLVKDYVASLNGQLTLFYLPPYAPQLNPDEQVWAHVKRQVSRQLVQSLDDMKSLALGALRRIQKNCPTSSNRSSDSPSANTPASEATF